MPDTLDEFKRLADRVSWRPIETAPKDQFVILYCPEDRSRWWAKWQGGEWYGCDEFGLNRVGHSVGDDAVTGWFVSAWMPIPDAVQKFRKLRLAKTQRRETQENMSNG